MRARLRFLLIVTVLGALAVAGPVSAVTTPTTIRLLSITTSEQVTDRPPKGASAGDIERSTSRLLNAVAQFGRKRGAVVGTDRGTVKVMTKTSAHVNGVARLPGGTIRFAGRVRARADGALVVAVTGGTGRFSGVRGTLVIVALDAKTAINEYQLTFAATA